MQVRDDVCVEIFVVALPNAIETTMILRMKVAVAILLGFVLVREFQYVRKIEPTLRPAIDTSFLSK